MNKLDIKSQSYEEEPVIEQELTKEEIEQNAKRAARAQEIAEKRRRQKELAINISHTKAKSPRKTDNSQDSKGFKLKAI